MSFPETYSVTVAGVSRALRLFEVAPGVRIAIINILGDVELTQAAAKELAQRLQPYHADVLLTAEAKSIPLIYALAVEMGLPYVVLRKSYKSYMGNAIAAQSVSITTNAEQNLYLDEKDQVLLRNRRVVLVDDVISTGSTLEAMQSVTEQVHAEVVAQAAIFTEGNDTRKWQDVVALGNLPVWIKGQAEDLE